MMECPTPCPKCGDIVEHETMKPARLACAESTRVNFYGKLLCRACCYEDDEEE